MKKIIAIVVCISTVCVMGLTCFAEESQLTKNYKYKVIRKDSYCSTEITIVNKKTDAVRILQVLASSSGVAKEGKSNETSGTDANNVSITDWKKPSDLTYHNTALHDLYGWYGKSCFLKKNATVTDTRTCK